MTKIAHINKVQEFLEDALARNPELLIIAFKDKKSGWITGVANKNDKGLPLEEILGMLEIHKAQILRFFFDQFEFPDHERISRGDDEKEPG